MWNFLIGKNNNPSQPAPPLRTDLHSHLIPAIDDGAQSDEEALQLLNGLLDLGYHKCIITPHCYPGLYNNTPATILSGLARLRDICERNSIPILLEAAAEYFFDHNFFELAQKKQLLTFGNNYVLFELPVNSRPSMMEEVIFNLNLNDYKPVLAHPERYPYFHESSMREYGKLKDYGVYFQLNLMSLTGYYNNSIRDAARALIRHEMVEFAGTDLHKQKHLQVLQNVQRDSHFIRLLSSVKLLNSTL
ncbi:MAG: hypothetical protein K1X61_02400 [Chitinophagales bacterium]|nr:hypothetical protein [Chitinophagales bacterium]